MTNAEQLMQWLNWESEHNSWVDGGHPSQFVVVSGFVVIAGTDSDGAPKLTVVTPIQARKWVIDIKKQAKKHGVLLPEISEDIRTYYGEDDGMERCFIDCINDARPDGIFCSPG